MPLATGISLVSVLAMVNLAGCANPSSAGLRTPQPIQIKQNRLLDILQSRDALIGKSESFVVRTIGSPDRQAGSGVWEWWMYDNRFHDLITLRMIPEATLVFTNGTLLDITY